MEDLNSAWVQPSLLSTLAFVAVLASVIVAFGVGVAWASRGAGAARPLRAGGLALLGALSWLAITGAYVAIGLPSRGPAGLVAFFVVANVGGVALAFSPLGTRLARHLPLAALVGFQAFRFPLELILHAWSRQGSLPPQMTYSGHNFDIVTGLAALVLLGLALSTKRDTPRRLALAFNLLGSGLLLGVVGIVLLSSPLPIKLYDGAPILLALHLPHAWIAPFCVAGALSAHLVLFRALLSRGPAATRAHTELRTQST